MAGLFLVGTRDPEFAERAMATARAQFRRHGFANAIEHDLPGWQLLHAPYILGGPENLLIDGDDLAAYAGTLVYDGLMGRPALERLLASITLPSPDWSRLQGQFILLVRKSGRTLYAVIGRK